MRRWHFVTRTDPDTLATFAEDRVDRVEQRLRRLQADVEDVQFKLLDLSGTANTMSLGLLRMRLSALINELGRDILDSKNLFGHKHGCASAEPLTNVPCACGAAFLEAK